MGRTSLGGIAAAIVVALLGCSADDASDAATTTTAGAPAITAASSTAAPTVPASTTSTVAATSSSPATNGGPAPTTAAPPTTAPATDDFGTARTVTDLLALGRPIVLAHTGGEDAYPGSTMFAFGESMKAGVDVLDLNVVLSGDGVLMVQHDETVDRQTESSGDVRAMTADQLHALDNAHWFTPDGVGKDHPTDAYLYRGIRTGDRPPPAGYTADDFAIPRLDELIARYPDVPLNIEIKGEGAPAIAAAEALATLLATTGRGPATVVTAFDDAVVTAFHAMAPEVALSPGLDASTAFVLGGTPLPDGMRILQLPPEYQGIPVLTPATIAAAHAADYLIWVWPTEEETPALYDALLAAGLDGLNANHPVEAIDAVRRFLEGR
jgi:glycerophosphoryl diester phosphodiesterase